MIIIDGHNLLHSVHKDENIEPVSDIELCRIIDVYLKQTSQSGEIIFDGTGPRDKDGFSDVNNLEVFYYKEYFSDSKTLNNTIIFNYFSKIITT